MKQAPKKNSGRKRLVNILAKMPACPQKDSDLTNCKDYNWLEPHCFNSTHIQKINLFAGKLAEQIKTQLKKYYGQNFEVKFDSIGQFFDEQLKSETPSENYCLAFTDEAGSIFGYLDIPQATAVAWTRQLLGDSHNTEEQNPQLSSLEISLLHDIAAEVINSISLSIPQGKIKPQGCITKNLVAMKFSPGQEICKLTFNFTLKDSEKQFTFSYLVLCNHITNRVLADADTKPQITDAEIKEKIIQNIKNIKIPLNSMICKQLFSLDELLSLEVDDILIFDKKIDDPVNILANQRPIFSGTIAKNEGHYAVIVK
ncbi:MAG: FliM/FliN family flagellar motor C-terminal domain-containing protein [Phycisphaerae bacterium]|nr:FliM/FliN family flagellar motor C-terminal domain-containing protein [Phycisphaerae bacterium]